MLSATFQFVIAMIACAINDRQQRKVEYLLEEVRVMKEALQAATGKSRINFTGDQRRRLAMKGRALTPEDRRTCCQIVKPETILAWFRQLAARKYDSSKVCKPGRPRKAEEIRKLVIKMAQENLGWGYTKIRDALRVGLKMEIGRTTVANILAEAGIVPAPERVKTRTWKQFLKIHADTLYACDFFSVETLGVFGAVRHLVFFVIKIKSRAVEIAGIRVDPDGEWMKQVARNLVDPVDGFLRNGTHLIHDGDPLFTDAFKEILGSGGIETVQIPGKSPNCNPHAERFVRTIRAEALRHILIFGERHLRHVIKEFVVHYLAERFHQGIGGQIIQPKAASANDNGSDNRVKRRSRLGGLLSFYHREAA